MRAALAACLLTIACALHAEGNPAPAMRAAAQNLLAALPQALQAQAQRPFDDAQRRAAVFGEYDASQNDGNRIHTVWPDFKGDFGRDLLREHYSWTRDSSHHRH